MCVLLYCSALSLTLTLILRTEKNSFWCFTFLNKAIDSVQKHSSLKGLPKRPLRVINEMYSCQHPDI